MAVDPDVFSLIGHVIFPSGKESGLDEPPSGVGEESRKQPFQPHCPSVNGV